MRKISDLDKLSKEVFKYVYREEVGNVKFVTYITLWPSGIPEVHVDSNVGFLDSLDPDQKVRLEKIRAYFQRWSRNEEDWPTCPEDIK